MIAVVVTAYKPDVGFAKRFFPLLSVCGAIVVSDNTPGDHTEFSLPEGFTLIRNLRNLGLAPALNIGIEAARQLGADTVVLFDQDSTPSPALIGDLLRQHAELVAANGALCCLGPTHLDDIRPLEPKTAVVHGEVPWQEVTCLPTSGMVFNLPELDRDDVFSDVFFLDLVDFEWCWRLRSKGWRFYRARHAVMHHRLGEAERRLAGLTFHVPAPYRHYFQVRDSLALATLPYVPLYSKLRLIGILPIKALVYPFLLDRGYERLRWMALGVRDRIRGISGIGAAASRLSQ